MKDDVVGFLKNFGVSKVGVADPGRGFGRALEGCHPRDVMENCNSVIVFALHVGLDYYVTLDYGQKEDVESQFLTFIVTGFRFNLQTFLRIKAMKLSRPSALRIRRVELPDYPSSWPLMKLD